MEEELRCLTEELQRRDAAARVAGRGAGNRAGRVAAGPADDAVNDFRPRTLRDYHIPRVDDAQGPIVLPELHGETPNFGSGVVSLIQ